MNITIVPTSNRALIWARTHVSDTQQTAADRIAVSRVTFNKWERGVSQIPWNKFQLYLDRVHLTVSQIPPDMFPKGGPKPPAHVPASETPQAQLAAIMRRAKALGESARASELYLDTLASSNHVQALRVVRDWLDAQRPSLI